MLSTEEGIATFFKDGQPPKVLSSMILTVEGIVTSLKFSHLQKANSFKIPRREGM